MSYEVQFYIKRAGEGNSPVIKTAPAPPAQAIKACLKALKKLGYPMRNTVTELIRELLYLKFEVDFKGVNNGTTELRGTDARRGAASVGTGKA